MSRSASPPPALLARFEAAGFGRAEPGVLQPAEPFLDVMGEELRQRMFLTSDAAGRELCLRPDFTIPVARLHIAGGDPARAAGYCYAGPVFRQGANGGEASQAGVESFGRVDSFAAEAELLALALEACALLGVAEPAIRLGDRALIDAAVDAISAPAAFRRRLKREIASGGALEALAPAQPRRDGEHAGLIAALSAAGPEAARGAIEDLLSLAGIAAVGGRTAGEIAERFLERTAAHAAALTNPEKRALDAFLAVDDPAPAALARLQALADRDGLAMGRAVEVFAARLEAFRAAGLPVERMRFSSRFGRRLDYYTGLVFELAPPAGGEPLAGGGRYDGLIASLGAASPSRGVGFALWLDRFGEGKP
jgi:ATP phosphoribosyltransferase regulatory subunit